MALSDKVRDVVEGALEPLDVDLYDLEQTGGTLRVTVDRPDGIDIDAVADATRAVSRALDEADPIPGAYHLEVTSPGLERSLRTLAHWEHAVGERVKVKMTPDAEGDRRVEGVVTAVDDDQVTLDVDGEEHHVRLGDVDRARTVFEVLPHAVQHATRPARVMARLETALAQASNLQIVRGEADQAAIRVLAWLDREAIN
jgi:ribosome maturation factor RimP